MDARGSLRQVALSQTLNQGGMLYFPSLVPDSKGLRCRGRSGGGAPAEG